MQAGDGGDQAEPQAAAGLRAALLQAHEALQRALAVLRRHARPAVGDGDLDRVADARQSEMTMLPRVAPSALAAFASSTEYLMALSTRLATAWLTSSRLAIEGQALRGVEISSAQARLLGDRLVELGDVAR